MDGKAVLDKGLFFSFADDTFTEVPVTCVHWLAIHRAWKWA